jgi:signal peptidase I
VNVVLAPPPMYDEIDAAFHVKGKKGIIFTWGDTIYVPNGGNVTPELRAHEGVHYSRQTNDTPKIEAWWRHYIADPAFRLAEELPAHRAEYKHFCSQHRDPNTRIRFLYAIAERLGGPLYGGLITASAARRSIAA